MRHGDEAVGRAVQTHVAPLLLARVGIQLDETVEGSARGERLPVAGRESELVLLPFVFGTGQHALKPDLNLVVFVPVRAEGELPDDGHIAQFEVQVVDLFGRQPELHRLQLLRRDDDAHLLQLLEVQVGRVELYLVELVGRNGMLPQGFQTRFVLRVVRQVVQRLHDLADLIGRDPQEAEILLVLLRFEAGDEGCGGRAVLELEESRGVLRKGLRRDDPIIVARVLEVGDGLHGMVALVVEQQRLLVLGIGLFGRLSRNLFFVWHNRIVLVEQWFMPRI